MEQRLATIVNFLSEKKAEDIETIDLKGKGYIVDSVIIATALNNKHSIALLNYLRETLKPLGEEFVRVEEDGEWSIIDMGDMLIHIMTQEHRDRYNIEEFLKEIKRG
ncbi:MAG: ribosome silencing factor [Arcobacteraceae bacterium]|nr:ribosome silencing factor [Arcobacteraceae bacterium]